MIHRIVAHPTRVRAAALLAVAALLAYPGDVPIWSALADTGGGPPSSSVVPDPVSDAVAAIAAEFRVDESGAATYAIPLFTLPGTAGVAPRLSLGYSSQAGHGPLGQGWSIAGFSTIARCRATREAGDFISGGVPVDGNPRPIGYTAADDRYCLDGQRLLAVTDGALCDVVVSGMTRQTYRTEIESFQRVCAYTPTATPGNGPAFFTVEREDGSISWYGDRNMHATSNRPDAYIETNAPGHTAVARVWAQTRFQDSTGNFFNYVYVENPGSPGAAEFLLKEVRYTGKNVLAGQTGTQKTPYARLIFNYTELPSQQWALAYSAQGATHTQRHRLDSITSCAAPEDVCAVANQVRHYKLQYEASNPSGSGLMRLSSVSECRDSSGSAVCAAPTTFQWTPGKHEFATIERPATPTLANDHIRGYKLADFNGDGRQDIAFQYLAGSGCVGGTWIVTTTSALDAGGAPTLASPQFNCVPANIVARGEGAWHLFDYDGDGRDDLFVSRGTNQGWQLHPSTGSGFNMASNLISGLSPAIPSMDNSQSQPQLADLNGDGLVDVIYPRAGTVWARLMERQGGGAFAWGAERAVQVDEASLWPDIGHGCGEDPPPGPVPPSCDLWMSGMPTTRTGFMQMADFNGDAASDVLLQLAGQVKVWTNNPDCIIPFHAASAGAAPRGVVARWAEPHGGQAQDLAQAAPTATDPCWDTFQINQLHTLVVAQSTASTITLSNHALVQTGNPETLVLGDANGDGLTDVFARASAGSDWSYRINTGIGFGTAATLPLANHREHARFADVTGDGRTDFLYLVETGGNKVYYVRRALPGGGFASGTALPGGNARLCEGNGCDPAQRAPLFADIDGDGNVDFLSFNFASANFGLYASRAGDRFGPRDVLARIVNGYGAATEIVYAPLTFKDLYRRDYNSRNTTQWGRGSPVSDLLAPIHAVARASSSSPQAGAPDAMANVHYRYAGAKLQAGGRGYLGFRRVVSFDPNQSATHYGTTSTLYRQDFPYTGMPQSTVKRVASGPYVVPPCLAGTVTDACFITPNQPFPPLEGATLSDSTQTWQSDTDIGAAVAAFAPGVQRPVHVRTAGTQETLSDPFFAVATSRVDTSFAYGAYGNVTQTVVEARTGAGALASTVTTANTYADNAIFWRLKRVAGSTVTHARPGRPNVVRTVSFQYAMAGAVTGLLTEERTQPGGGNALDLRTLYALDEYGNRTRTTLCAHAANCDPSALVFQPAAQTTVHRTSRVVYDEVGRYPVETWEPFRTAAGHAEARTSHVVGRDIFGNVTRAYDLNGLDRFAVHGTLGRAYYAWTETVAASTPGDPATGVASTVTYRWCGAGGSTVACPAGAKFRQQTETTAAPTQWSYHDALGRPILQLTQSFNAGTAGKDASAVCTAYDAAGRPKQVSNPFFLPGTVGASPAPAANTCTAAGLAWTTTSYDALGRPVQATTPNDTGGTITVSTAYNGLTATTTNPRGHPTAQTRNALGEVVQVTDALGTATAYSYFADGTLERVRRGVGRGDVDNTFAYDVLGRKVQQVDPDSGTTQFTYNAGGELLAQQDAAGNRTEQWYDARGRVWKKQVKRAAGTVESESLYAWDTAGNGQGQLASESISGTYDAWVGQSGTALTFSRSYSYDTLGRPLGSTTGIDGVNYTAAVQYDSRGRGWKAQDASGRWSKTEFTARGYTAATCESSAGDATATCPGSADTWVRLQETDARGQVLRERRGNSAAMDVVRSYGAGTGRIASICAGNAGSCSLVDEGYAWDAAGNLAFRTKESRYAESFHYDALDRLTHAYMTTQNGTVLPTPVVLHWAQFDGLGNICAKSIDGSGLVYGYQGRAGCGVSTPNGSGTTGTTGPHRAVNVGDGVRQYSYDARGNQTLRNMPGTASDRTVRYSLDDKAHEIVLGTDKTGYWYGPDGQRYKREHLGKRTLYLGNVEIETVGATTTIKRTVAGAMLQTIVSGTATNHYLFHDQLGSLVKTTNASGTAIDGLDYAAYGLRVSHSDPTVVVHTGSTLTARGFTGHEHLDAPDMDLIHMNGRIYDPEIGRFLQADPIIQAPDNLQSWNAYTYVFNNPLKYTDPTGMFSLRQALGIVIAIVGTIVTQGMDGGFFAKLGMTMLFGAASGYVATGTLRGAVMGAFTAGATFGAGWMAQGWGPYGQFITHATTGGIIESIQGGNFGHGFVAAGLTAAFMPMAGHGDTGVRAVRGALIGGTISELTGGKFANGALSGAIQGAMMKGDWDNLSPEHQKYLAFSNDSYNSNHGDLISDEEFKRAGGDPDLLRDKRSGFSANLYRDGSGVIVAITGSNQIRDWIKTNFLQAFGLGVGQYKFAARLAMHLQSVYGNNLVFTGHSLGGGLAAVAALSTGLRAVTFNAAGVHSATLRSLQVPSANAGVLITAYRSSTDVLSSLQSLTPLPNALGRHAYLQPAGIHGTSGLCRQFGPCY